MTGAETKREYFQNGSWKNQFIPVIGRSLPLWPQRVNAAPNTDSLGKTVYTPGQSDLSKFICDVSAGVLKFSLNSKSSLPWRVTSEVPVCYIRRPEISKSLQEGRSTDIFWSVICIIIIAGRKKGFELLL